MAFCSTPTQGGEVIMSSTASAARSELSAARWAYRQSADPDLRLVELEHDRVPGRRPPPRKRASRAFVRLLVTFCFGVAATLAWQSYGGVARAMIASVSPQLDWLAPLPAPDETTAAALTAPGIDQQQLNAMARSLDVVRRSVDQLASQLAVSQQQMAREITKLQAAEQDILDKVSASAPKPASVPVRKPAPVTQAPPSQALPMPAPTLR
jgi:hypothetical protein